jgi:hypothetical protein
LTDAAVDEARHWLCKVFGTDQQLGSAGCRMRFARTASSAVWRPARFDDAVFAFVPMHHAQGWSWEKLDHSFDPGLVQNALGYLSIRR